MIRILSFAALLYVATPGAALAQAPAPHPEEAAILTVVDRFMLAISTNDSAALAELRIEGGSTIVSRPNAAEPTAPLVTRRVFTTSTGSKPTNNRERYWDPVVHVRGGIAVVWTPYEFWVDGKTSHCGIDVFDFVKIDGAWRVSNSMWTVEPGACAELRPEDTSKIRPAS